MARINHISIALCVLPFTTLLLTPMAHASKQVRESSAATHITKKVDKKKSTAAVQKTQKASQKTAKKAASKSTIKGRTTSSAKKSSITAPKNVKTRSRYAVNKTASANFIEKCTKRKGYESHCVRAKNAVSGTLADAHKAKVQKATKVATGRLMQQIGKPYRQGSSSLHTDFGCSNLVYRAYKDLMKIHIPRTANEMRHLCDTVPIERSELKDDNLAFFRIQGHGTADHVGAYVGNDKSIQSPCTDQEVQITPLNENYWQRHYVGARRIMIPKTLR